MIYLPLMALCGVGAAAIGYRRGGKWGVLWFFAGLMGPIGLVVAFIFTAKRFSARVQLFVVAGIVISFAIVFALAILKALC